MSFVNEILKNNTLSIVKLEKNIEKTEYLKFVLEHLSSDKKSVAVTTTVE